MDQKLQVILDELKGLRKSQDEFKEDLQQFSANQKEFKDNQIIFKKELSELGKKQDETKTELNELKIAQEDTKSELKAEFEELKTMLKHNTALMIESQFAIRKDLRIGIESTNTKIEKLSKSIIS